MKTAPAFLALALIFLLPACGGGGAGTQPGTVDTFTLAYEPNAPGGGDTDGDGFASAIRIDRTLDIMRVGDGEVDGGLGDIVGNAPFFAFVFLPLSTLPADARVVGAELEITVVGIFGTPFADLAALRIVRIDPATPLTAAGISGAPALTSDPAARLPTPPNPVARISLGALQVVQAAQAAGEDLLLRLEFEVPTDGQTDFDVVEIATTRSTDHEGPILRVTFER